MKLHYFFHSARTNLLYVFILVLVSSCTIYVPVTDDDGIYSSRKRESQVHKKKVIIADNSKSYKKFEENYFDKELKRLQQDYDTTDVFTEIDNYSSDNTNDDDYTYHNEDYDSNRGSWGYSDNNHVVIHLDFRPRFYNPRYHSPFWFDGWSYWDSYYNYYDYYPYYTWHRPRWNWRWNRWNSWRYGSYWDPFRPHYYGYAFYNPYNYWNNFPRYYRGYTPRNYRYGKRVAYNNRNYYSNTRSNTARR